ncbi:MAG: TVP38/TMEM64 family protein [Rhodospirillum sp.]|nr:TVP38/TMEM64 family protein [Rhodospirillum sp.]MCF8488913.1 TVP38/TMEM64 family protein [Rhodospirillum sp.]MCF8498969.1 TVP38/TMEM64 family protein [Rhodospirillum sp.]
MEPRDQGKVGDQGKGSATSAAHAPKVEVGWPWGRLLALGLFVAVVAGVFASGVHHKLSFTAFAENHEVIQAWVDRHGLLAIGVFILLYFVAVTFSLPGAVWITIIGGYVFGVLAGTVYVVLGATLGATGIFLLARYVLGDSWKSKLSGKMAQRMAQRMERGFRDHAFSYLLVLRLVPLFPFWLVNLVPAFAGVPTRTYVLGTFLGIIPGTAVYASVGNGLGAVLEAGGRPDLSLISDPVVFGPLLGLAALALVPVAYKRLRGGKKKEDGDGGGDDIYPSDG